MPAPYYDDLYSDLPADGDVYEDGTQQPDLSSEEASSSGHQAQSLHQLLSTTTQNHQGEEEVDQQEDEDISQYLSPADGFHYTSSSSGAHHVYPNHQPGLPYHSSAVSTLGDLNFETGTSHHGLDQSVPITSGTQPTSAAVPIIPNVLVEDPSLAPGSTAASKAREARRERDRSGSLNTPADPDAPADPLSATHQRQDSLQASSSEVIQQQQQQHPREASSSSVARQQGHSRQPSRQFSERTPLFNVLSEAPPAYTPSPTSPTTATFSEAPGRGSASPQTQSESGYQTFPNIATMGREGEGSQWLLGHGPESMGNPQQGQPPQDGDGIFYRRKRPMSAWRNFIVRLFFFALLVSVFAGFLATIARAIGVYDKLPSDRKQRDRSNQTPIYNPLPSEGKGDLTWEPYPYCAPGTHKFDPRHYPLDFSASKSATLVQTVEQKYHGGGGSEWHLDVRGDVILKRVKADRDAGFDVEVLANNEKLAVEAQWDSNNQHLKLTIPRVFVWHESLRPCIQMRVTVRIPEGAELQQFQVVAVHLDVSADSDLHLKATNSISLETVSGDVRVHEGAKLDCRSISIHTVSGDVDGTLPLYDNLDIATASGSVDCQVNPQPVDESNPKKANLEVGTMSGDIRIREPISDESKIPARDYVVDLESYSGDIDAHLAVSSKLVLETHSGTISSNILPVLDPGLTKCGSPVFSTSSYSGDQIFSVLEPLWTQLQSGSEHYFAQQSAARVHEEHALDCLSSTHSAISGDVDARYPSSWSGRFAAQSVSGSLKVSGKDVVLDSSTSRPGMRSIKGHHYDGDSSLVVGLVSGDVKILIGTE